MDINKVTLNVTLLVGLTKPKLVFGGTVERQSQIVMWVTLFLTNVNEDDSVDDVGMTVFAKGVWLVWWKL